MDLLKYLTVSLRNAIREAWLNDYGFNEDELLDMDTKLSTVSNKAELLRTLFNINPTTDKLCYDCSSYTWNHGDTYYCKKYRMLVFNHNGNPVPITGKCYRQKDPRNS